jgi:molybdopterin synthase catalytic subunit
MTAPRALGARLTAALVDRPIDPASLLTAVADHRTGATVLFLGTVRDTHDGRAVIGIDYHAYTSMAEREIRSVIEEAARRFDLVALAVEHRIGYLELGDVSVGVAASHPRRQPALDATACVIDEIKRRVPIWKREHYADGTREWVDPTRATQGAAMSAGAELPL